MQGQGQLPAAAAAAPPAATAATAVSAAEAMAAVRDVLTAAGLPLDVHMQAGELVERTLVLREELREARGALQARAGWGGY